MAFCLLVVNLHAAQDLGPIYDSFDLTLQPGHETDVVGPLFYDKHAESGHTWAFPPFFSDFHDPATETEEIDGVYPLLTYDRYGQQYRWQLFQIFSFAGGPTQNAAKEKRFTIFPLYFQQRSSDPSENYTALIPFYGHLKDRLFRNDIFFVMWPVYVKTRKGEVVTVNYMVPFFDVRHGPGLKGWQLLPFYGTEHKEITTRTNGFGDIETVPGYDKKFVMWPFYFNQHTDLGTTNPAWNSGVLPLYALERSPERHSTTVLWPFFSHVIDREQKYREWDAPWPFIEYARGEGKHTTRVWPFFSHAHSPTLEDNFYFWPVYKVDAIHSAPLERRRRRILFFVYSDIFEKNTETGQFRRRTDFWPLFLRKRDLNGNTRFQVLALIEGWTIGSHKMERDWSPVWSVWVSEHNARTQASSQSLLWGLYRREATPERAKTSALFGLFQYQRGPEGKRVRVLYIPFGKGKAGGAVAWKN